MRAAPIRMVGTGSEEALAVLGARRRDRGGQQHARSVGRSLRWSSGPAPVAESLAVVQRLVPSSSRGSLSQAELPPKPIVDSSKSLCRDTTHLVLNHPSTTMAHVAPTAARQALRIASRRYPSSTFARLHARPAAANAVARRTYVSETKPSNATVNIDSTIKADQKAFMSKTGTRPQDATMPTTGMSADAMMSPAAGSSFPAIHPT